MSALPDIAILSERAALGHSRFLHGLFTTFRELNIRYAVLHSAEMLPVIDSDLDIVVHPADRDRIHSWVRSLAEQGYRVVHRCEYAVGGYRFDFAWLGDEGVSHLGVDLTFEFRIKGLCVLAGEWLLSGAELSDWGFAVRPAAEYAYLLAKRAAKQEVSPRQIRRIQSLHVTLSRAQRQDVHQALFGGFRRETEQAVEAGSLERDLPAVRRAILNNVALSSRVRQRVQEQVRLLRRWLRPDGAFVVLLGPDGSGKNEVIAGLTQQFGEIFRQLRHYHWRYGVMRKLPKQGKPVSDPHAQRARGYLVSTFVMATNLLDFWFGYYLSARPVQCRSGLILFNRYYEDIQVDPQRYAYGGPARLLSALARSIPPQRRITLLVDAPADVIRARKPELPVFELERQRLAFLSLAGKKNWVVIDTGGSLSATRRAASEALIAGFHREVMQQFMKGAVL